MKRSVLMFIVMSATVILPAKPSWACSCVQSTPNEHAARADVIFTGTATDHESQEGGVHTYWTSFDVEVGYKRTLGPKAAVETGGDSAGSFGIIFKEGERYTVFARAQADGLDTDICMGTTDGPIVLAVGSVLLLGTGLRILGRRRSRSPGRLD